jgi:nucleoid-associated protein YgaU
MLYPVMLLVGVGIGTGVGMLISKPRIDEKKKEIDLLVTQMQTAKTDSDKTIQLHKSELMRMKNMLMQTTTKLADINAELKEIENRTPESPATSEPEVVITTPSDTNRTPSTVPTTDYIIEDGDSFWKIAQEELGDGNRYTEILDLNPDISENQTLIIGTKIKIPTR